MSSKPGRKPAGRKGAGPSRRGSGPVVEIFTASFCPHCQEAKHYFRMHKIPFKEHNLERSASAEKRFRGYGGKAIPLILVKGKVLRRWDPEAFEKAYRG